MALTTATSQQAANGTTSTVTLPTHATGDLLIALVGLDVNASTSTWTSGWTEIKDETATAHWFTAAWKKAASGAEASPVATHTSERSNHISICVPAAEWDGTTAPEISANASGSSTTPDPPSLTPSWGSAATIWVAILTADDSATPFPVTAWPTNYTNNQVSNVTATSAAAIAIASRVATTATENPGTFTMTVTETWQTYTLAIRPPAGNVTITPGVTALTTAVFAPSIKRADTYTVPLSTFTTATFAPTLVSGTKYEVPLSTFTTATFAPTLTITNNVLLTVPLATLTTATFAPVLVRADKYTVPLSTFTTATFAPTLIAGTVLSVPLSTFTTALFAPSLVRADTYSVPLATLTTALFAPTLVRADTYTVPLATLTTATFAPVLTIGGSIVLDIPPATLTTATFAPSLVRADTYSVPLTALTTATFAPVLTIGGSIVLDIPPATLTTATFAPTLVRADTYTVPLATLTTALFAPSLVRADTYTVPLATLTTATFAPSLAQTFNAYLVPDPVQLLLTGYAPELLGSLVFRADVGTVDEGGKARRSGRTPYDDYTLEDRNRVVMLLLYGVAGFGSSGQPH